MFVPKAGTNTLRRLAMLTDLAFVEAKCIASMTFELAADYRLAIAEYPALKAEETRKKSKAFSIILATVVSSPASCY